MTRENIFLESSKALLAQDERRESKRLKKILEESKAREAFKDNYYRLAESREVERIEHEKFMEAARDDAFSTTLKAIYLTALEAATLTDQGIILAENMVDAWIAENGGATKILGKAKNKTYFLSRLAEIVEDAALAAVAEAEDDSDPAEEEESSEEADKKDEKSEDDKESEDKAEEKDDADKEESKDDSDKEAEDDKKPEEDSEEKEPEEKPEDDNEKPEDKSDDDKESEDKSDDNEKSEDKSEDSEEEEEVDVKVSEEDKDGDKTEDYSEELDELSNDEVDPDEEASEDDDVEEIVGEPIDDDGLDSDDTVDGEDDKGQLMTDLEAEPDVQKAVELIRTRVADAEETFIRNNAKDKKEIDQLVNRLSDSIKAVDSIKDKDSREAKVAKEHVDDAYRDLAIAHEGYISDVFSSMARALNRGILKDKAVLEKYSDADGKLDTDLVVEATKVMYGFMETLNTLQLAKVDEEYIAEAIKEMER